MGQSPSLAVQPQATSDLFAQHVMATYGRYPLVLERGRGSWVWDRDGKQYLDCVAGIATCTLGHAHPVMVAAVTRQMETLHHVSNLYYIRPQGELAEWLTQHSCADKVFFCNSGAEANEGAIKLARKYAHTVLHIEEPVILTAHSSFHGRTLATITATGQPKYRQGFEPLVSGFDYIPFNDIEGTRAVLDRYADRACAVLIEPLQGEGGVVPGDRAYFQWLRQECSHRNLLLVLDEVQVGVGRSGKWWGYEQLDIEPDVFTLAKGLAGGFPIGALLCKESCNVFQPGDHASTFGGNPLACAVGLAVVGTVESDRLLDNARERGQQLRQGLQAIAEQFPALIEGIRGWGLINGLVVKVAAGDVVQQAIAAGLLLVPAGKHVVRFLPPLNISAAEIDLALERLQVALKALCVAAE
ncbi:aspartate aminotransferase family protein [Synechococcus sp. PCC 7336]|uniref:aspartate aminotransferase family protein n=1 Tax=Synechococcus sp. PCC 7336 TaxID=195250 RepID=UPI00034BD5B0|nr:aspartate aminotransferase family protein [Synechococcus sp. PCC 7336]